MRPLRLEVSGLTCFRDQVAIDFSTLELVAIEGPTGAGKSSLLDAMILALFGVVPRMGARNLGELISHGRTALAVTLDFVVRGEHWRVTRTLSRNRPSQAILATVTRQAGAPVETRKASGVLEVQREVRQLLGIDVAAFQQSVILPQGRFQEFLQSTPADRRRILGELLGLQVYGLMRARAAETATRLAAEVDTLGRQLAGDLSLASETLVAEIELQLGLAQSEREASRAAEAARRTALGEVERAATKCLELKAIDDALVLIEAREPAMSAAAERARRAREVASLVPLIDAALAAAARTLGLEERRTALARRLAEADTALDGALEAARDAESAALAIAGHRARMTLLDEARARFEEREELGKRMRRLDDESGAIGATLEQARRAMAAAEAELTAGRERLGALEGVPVPAVAPEESARWEALREAASQLVMARRQLAREREALTSGRALVAASEGELERAERDRKLQEHAELLAEEALEAARSALTLAEHEARVSLLREHLHAGEACPVCQQPVARVPEGGPSAELTGPREILATQKNALEMARGGAERARARAAEARARNAEATAREVALAAELARHEDGVRELEARLVEVVGEGAGAPEDRFQVGLEAIAARGRKSAAHAAAVQELRLAVERAEIACERRRVEVAQGETRLAELEQARREARARVGELEAALATVGGADPKKERASLERVIGGLEAGLKATGVRLSEAREAVAALQAEARTLSELAASAATEQAAAQARLDEVLSERGLADMAAVRTAALAPEAIDALEAEVQAHRAERQARVERRAEVVRELGPLRAGPDEVALARAELERATAQAEEAATRAAVLGERLRGAREQLARVGGVKAEYEAKARQLEVYRRIADDLRTNHFQDYLLEEVVADLVRGASERLFVLSGGRYRMAVEAGGGFQVQDIDHGGERRSTDTLSGGETFLASLAMALELSEQIRAKAGRVDLDCIFIDEGFGALDPETLETVTEAVEGLRRPGRLVGIITHVGELAQRMPERLLVEKAQGGSSVHIVTS